MANGTLENYPDKYDISVLPHLRYSQQYLVDGWGLSLLIHIPNDKADWDWLAVFTPESTDSIAENGTLEYFGGTLTIYPDEKDHGGKRMSSIANIYPGQEPAFAAFIFDGQSYEVSLAS